MPMLFLHTVKNSFYKGVLLVRVFQTKKKGNFRTKFGTFIFFPVLMGSQPYLQGISTLRRPFRKKKVFCFFLNQCKIYGDFCRNFHFFKNNGQKWGVRRVRNFRSMSKFSKKIIFRCIALCSQSFVFIVLLVQEQYGPLFDFQKWCQPFLFFSYYCF
jgi:hypothetical protein